MHKYLLCMLAIALSSSYAYSQCACCAGAGAGSSNGDFNNGILTLPKNEWAIEAYSDFRTIQQHDEAPHIMTEDMDMEEESLLNSMLINSVGVRYGVTSRFTVAALLPYTILYTETGHDKGLGDLLMMGTYNLYSKNTFNVAMMAGVELPTGVQKESAFDNTTVVIGSGSVDPLAGLVFSKKWDRWMLQGNTMFKYTTPGFNDNYYGNLSTQQLSLGWRISKSEASCSTDSLPAFAKANFTVSAGYYGEWLDKIREEGEVDENSGYYLGFGTMNLRMNYGSWTVPFTFSYPLVQQMNGDQTDAGYRLRLGVIRTF